MWVVGDVTSSTDEPFELGEVLGVFKAVAAEMNAFPSTKPRPKHDRRAPRAGGAAAQSWGFHTSGFHRRSDDELENRVKRWSDAARIERVENIQRLDATGAMN